LETQDDIFIDHVLEQFFLEEDEILSPAKGGAVLLSNEKPHDKRVTARGVDSRNTQTTRSPRLPRDSRLGDFMTKLRRAMPERYKILRFHYSGERQRVRDDFNKEDMRHEGIINECREWFKLVMRD